MAADPLHSLLRDANGESFHFVFNDGEQMLAEVVSASHVDADDTVIILRVGALPTEPGYQVQLSDIRSVMSPDNRPLFDRVSP
jgi:hypothetical protein